VTIHRSPGCPDFDVGCDQLDDQVEVPDIMRALDPEVVDTLWEAVEPLVPEPIDTHPLGLSPATGP